MNEASRDDDDVMNGSHDDSDFDMDATSPRRVKEKVPA